ncbi:MAG: protein kinase, partial [Acidobacteriota bacterium]|nr:protein kinase [Acidobacteriota bacterium]
MKAERWQQIESIFQSALALKAGERADYVDKACAEDKALQQEVESLLAAYEKTGSFMNMPAHEVAAQLLAADGSGLQEGRQGDSNKLLAAPGTLLGRYEILSQIGAGGMGEVYRARDTKLGRDVAIKVLPAAFSAETERLRRFGQEAQAAGSLNHPNILAIHDIGTHDGAPYIVSELLEGETLREQMNGTALPARKAIDYALQIASALAAAHGKGIVHRDLKPENIFVTRDGRLKILDFGIAKLIEPSREAQTDVPTRRINTEPGTVIGTVGYMSPEQVRAQPVDHRSDIFSFGVVLYEMLSGRRAFKGESAVETLNAILTEDPADLSTTDSQVAPGVGRVVRHCLEKNPEQRFQSARDVAFALEGVTGLSGSASTQVAAASGRTRPRERLPWIAAGLLLLTAIAFATLYFRREMSEVRTVRFLVYPPEKGALQFINRAPHVISPDGRRLALTVTMEGRTQIWVRLLASPASQPLAGTEDGIN